jgi:hypothetical protein
MSISAEIDFSALAAELESTFEAWEARPEPWSDERFESFALRVFALQYEANRPYRRYCRSIGRNPDSVCSWKEIPAVPTAAFRHVELIVGDPGDAALRFRTSGTTGGAGARGVHPVRRPETYTAALAGPFRHFVLSGMDSAMIVAIHSPFDASSDSSLAWMLDHVLERFGSEGSRRLDPAAGLTAKTVLPALEDSAASGRPVVLLGTTLVMAEIASVLGESGASVELPAGSRPMDTGGTKGRAGLDRPSLFSTLLPRLGLGPQAVVNEFGMTELLSQRYGEGLGPMRLEGPPWLRTRVLHPVSLEEMPPGDEGVLCHYDLANVGSVFGVLTEDRGRDHGDAIEWLGRTPGAPPRGCSIATAELLEAQDA